MNITTDAIVLIGIFGFAIAIMIAAAICFVKITILPIKDDEEDWDEMDDEEDLEPLHTAEKE